MANGSIIGNPGKQIMIHRTYEPSPTLTAPTLFKVGYLNDTPDVADTDLDNPIDITGSETVDAFDVLGNYNTNASGTNTVTLNTTNGQRQEGIASINFVKSDATNATMSSFDTVTSLDFTNKTFLIWFFITDKTKLATTAAVTVRYGSDASNYFEEDRDNSEIFNGWNTISFTSATADSTTGSPVITAMDFLYIEIETTTAATTIAEPDCRWDFARIADSTDFTKAFNSGFPTFDDTNFEVAIECTLLITEANGFLINGFGLFNTDSTVLMHSQDTITGDSKSNTDEFIYTAKDRLV